MKNLIKATALILSIIMLCSLVACGSSSSSGEFPNTQSGFHFPLNESVLNIQQNFKVEKEKDGYVCGADIKINIKGFSSLSYYDCEVTFNWTYEFLNDQGEYEIGNYSVTVELDASGNAKYSESIEFDGCRNVKDVKLELEFKGEAVKK